MPHPPLLGHGFGSVTTLFWGSSQESFRAGFGGYRSKMTLSNEEPSADESVVSIRTYPDGPYLVRGSFRLEDADSVAIDTHRAVIALCRCGRSRMAPICDGSHTRGSVKSSSEPA